MRLSSVTQTFPDCTSKPRQRHGNVNILRFFAAMMVVLYHYAYTGPASVGLTPVAFPELLPLTQHRWVGAWFFFIVSGFSICFAARKVSASRFLTARIARIYPTFLLCMCMTSVVLMIAAPQNIVDFQMSWARWLANLSLVPKFFGQHYIDGVYWSLVVEISFYIGVCVLLACGIFYRHMLTILSIWLGMSLLNEFWFEQATLSKTFTRYSCFFALGMLSYRVLEADRRPQFQEIALALVALLLAMKADYNVNAWLHANLSSAAEWNASYALFKTVFMLAVLNLAVRTEPVLNEKLSKLLGNLCFPVYLLHCTVGFVMFHHLSDVVNRWVALALTYALVLCLSFVVARYFDPKARMIIFYLADLIKGMGAAIRNVGPIRPVVSSWSPAVR